MGEVEVEWSFNTAVIKGISILRLNEISNMILMQAIAEDIVSRANSLEQVMIQIPKPTTSVFPKSLPFLGSLASFKALRELSTRGDIILCKKLHNLGLFLIARSSCMALLRGPLA